MHAPHDFDAHIYFVGEKESDLISALKSKIEIAFDQKNIFIGNIIPYPIGPHPLPMLEVNFGKERFSDVLFFLMKERGSLNILVHSLSEDDFYDHSAGAIWLGKTLELDFSRFK